jgi:hypothetical protein
MRELSEESGIPEEDNNKKELMSNTLPNPKGSLKNIKPSSFGGVKAAVSWLFKQLFKVDVAKDFNAKALSKSFLREYPPTARYKFGVWDASIVINYYRNLRNLLVIYQQKTKSSLYITSFWLKPPFLLLSSG